MKYILVIVIALTLMSQSPLAQPIPSGYLSSPNDYVDYAPLFEEVKLLTEKIEALMKKALPQIPQSPEYEIFRKKFKEYLQLRSDYKAVESKENCGGKALELFNAQHAIISMYTDGHTAAEGSQEVMRILNEQGMQKIKDDIDDIRARGAFGKIQRKPFEEYIMEHC